MPRELRSESLKNGLLIAGHVVIDEVIDSKNQKRPRISLGGGAAYGSVALSSLGYGAKLVSVVGGDFPARFARFLGSKVGCNANSLRAAKERTTRYRIDRSLEPRKLWLKARCRPIAASDFPDEWLNPVESSTIILNPVAGEISPHLVRKLCGSKRVFMDSQGFVRQIGRRYSEVTMRQVADHSFLRGVSLLKADKEELRAWSGKSNAQDTIRLLSKYVERILVTSGPDTVELYEGAALKIRAIPFKVRARDTTGAGDILLACFAAKYSETQDCSEALKFAVSASTLSVRKPGIEKAILSHSEVLKCSEKVVICD